MLPLYLIIWNGNSGHTFTSIECTTICVIEMVVLCLVGATLMWETTMEQLLKANWFEQNVICVLSYKNNLLTYYTWERLWMHGSSKLLLIVTC